jgi:GxxExxY protein
MSYETDETAAAADFEAALSRSVKRVLDELDLGLTEVIYRKALALELREAGYRICTEVPMPIVYYMNETLGTIPADLVVYDDHWKLYGREINRIVELKVAAKITDAHVTRANAYAKRSPKGSTAYVVNFGPEDVEIKKAIRTDASKRKREDPDESYKDAKTSKNTVL